MEKACRLTNTTYWDIAPSLPLPSLPLYCGASDPSLSLSEDSATAVESVQILEQAPTIADFLGRCDVSYLNLKEEGGAGRGGGEGTSLIYEEVLKHDGYAFQLWNPGPCWEKNNQKSLLEGKPCEKNVPTLSEGQAEVAGSAGEQLQRNMANEVTLPLSSRKHKVKKKEQETISLSTEINQLDQQDVITSFCEIVEDFCGRAEVSIDDQGEADGTSFSLSDIKLLIDEILSPRTKKVLHYVPVETLSRLLAVLDNQIHCGQGLSLDDNESTSCDLTSSSRQLPIFVKLNRYGL